MTQNQNREITPTLEELQGIENSEQSNQENEELELESEENSNEDNTPILDNTFSKYQLLNKEQEIKYINQLHSGNQAAKNMLICSNQGLVIKIARTYINKCKFFDLNDLIQEGNIGLMKAIEKFDPVKGFRLSTYATWWIKQAIGRAIEEREDFIRIPNRKLEDRKNYYSLKHSLESKLHRNPTDDEIIEASEGKLSSETITNIHIYDMYSNVDSLSRPIKEDSKQTMEDVVCDSNEGSLLSQLHNSDLKQRIYKLLDILEPKERTIIEKHFNLKGGKEYTLEEIGKEFKLTRERVRQIESKAIYKIRNKILDEKDNFVFEK